MKTRILPLCLLLSACVSTSPHSDNNNRAPAEALAATIVGDIPSPQAFIGWRDQPNYISSPVPYENLQKIAFNCDKPTLYPTHPQQSLKLYHVFRVGNYDHFKLQGDDEVCKVGQSRPNGSGKKPCFSPDYLEYSVVSDTYEDQCGHFYRGYHESMFLKKNETMGSLFSIGRSSFANPRSAYNLDMVDGHTYPVALKEFLFLTQIFPGEEAKIRGLREKALADTHRYDPETRTFQPKAN